MYEIWSLGHKPFEAFNNNEVLLINSTRLFNYTYMHAYGLALIDNQASGRWSSASPSTWVSQGIIQTDDGVLVSCWKFKKMLYVLPMFICDGIEIEYPVVV